MEHVQFSFSFSQRNLLVEALESAIEKASLAKLSKEDIQKNRASARANGYGNLPKEMVSYDHRLVFEIGQLERKIDELSSLRNSISA